MKLSKKKLREIHRAYPGKQPEQIAGEQGIKPSQVLQALGLHRQLWDDRLQRFGGWTACALVLLSPLVFLKSANNFADLPQRTFIQAAVFFLLAIWSARSALASRITMPPALFCVFAGLFSAWSVASIMWSSSRYDAFYAAVHWTVCLFCVVSLYGLLTRNRLWIVRLLTALLIATYCVVILGLGQQFAGWRMVPAVSSPAATFANVNMASQFIVIALPLLAALALITRTPGVRPACLALLPAMLVFLYYTRCKAGWVALALSGIWALVCLAKAAGRPRLTLSVCAVLAAIAIIITVTAGHTGRLHEAINRIGGSAHYRLVVLSNSMEMIGDRPLAGFGAGNFKVFYPAYTLKAAFDRAFGKEKQIRRGHNDYVQTAVELGIPGGLLFLAIPLWGLWRALQLISSRSTTGDAVLAGGISSAIVAFMTSALFSFPMQRALPPFLFCIGLALLIVMERLKSDKRGFAAAVPGWVGAILCAAVIAAGASLTYFNINNIRCDTHFQTALRMERKGNSRRALYSGLAAHRYNRHRMDVLSTVGRAYVTTGQMEEAKKVLGQVVRVYPYHLNALFILGAAYANSGDSKQALDTFRKVLAIKPNFPEAKKIYASLKARGTVRIKLQ